MNSVGTMKFNDFSLTQQKTQILMLGLKTNGQACNWPSRGELQRFEHDRCPDRGEECAGAQNSKWRLNNG